MQVFSVFDLTSGLADSGFPIKVVFFPLAETESAKTALREIKNFMEVNPKSTVIILNVYC